MTMNAAPLEAVPKANIGVNMRCIARLSFYDGNSFCRQAMKTVYSTDWVKKQAKFERSNPNGCILTLFLPSSGERVARASPPAGSSGVPPRESSPP